MALNDSTAAVQTTEVVGDMLPEDSATPLLEPKTSNEHSETERGSVKGRAKGKGKGKVSGKGKGKGKGKRRAHAKAKASAKARARAQERASTEIAEGEDAVVDRPAKIPKLSLRSQVASSIVNRDIQEVLAEAKLEVQAMQESIEKAAAEERSIDEQLQALSRALAEASAKVEGGVKQEELALDKLRKSRDLQIEATVATAEARSNQDAVAKQMRTLELEVQAREQVTEYEQAKHAAREAAEAAKKALQEAKLREKEAAEAMRIAIKEQRQKHPIAILDKVESDEQNSGKDKVKAHKETAKASALEIKAIEKMRFEREKRREASLKEANGVCKRKGKGAGKSHCAEEDAAKEAETVDAVVVL
eukprot:TRINITY_DN36960_c0_g1_i1.p1 TRINITY_DN36960_c0_g1~~TRINITY_DN36960_c0_g1_i1.p1  ORF type:complete len:362 (+),score=115.98 TRINITY_DN36960_c0_g1_i1:85-1170(+)